MSFAALVASPVTLIKAKCPINLNPVLWPFHFCLGRIVWVWLRWRQLSFLTPPDSISTLATWPLSTKANCHGLMSLTSTSLLANHVHFTSCREMKSGSSFSLFLKVIRWCWCVGEITHQIHPSVQTVNGPDRGKAQALSRQVFKIDHSSKHEVMNEILANMQPHNWIAQEKIWRRTCQGFPLLRSSQLKTTPAQTKRSHRVQSVWCPMSDTSGARWPDRSFRKCSQSRAAAWTVDSRVWTKCAAWTRWSHSFSVGKKLAPRQDPLPGI